MVCQKEEDNDLAGLSVQMVSNDGWNSVVFEFKKTFAIDHCQLVLAALRINGRFWDREKDLAPNRAELTDDHEVHLHQVILSELGLRKLSEYLESWLANPFEFEVDLTWKSDPTLSIFVGPRDDFISQLSRPVFSLRYATSRMKAEWCFVTDQSCINLMLEGLTTSLSRLGLNRMKSE